MAMSSLNVFLMTSQVFIHFAQDMAEASFDDEPVWIAVALMKNLPEIL